MNRRIFGAGVAAVGARMMVGGSRALWAQGAPQPGDLLRTMLAREQEGEAEKTLCEYRSVERSERTGGALWTENVVETPTGRVRFLLAIDGKPLSAERSGQERGRLADMLANPQVFEAAEKAQKGDEAHAREMMNLLPKAFLLENMRPEGEDWRVDYRPDPAYSPSGIQEKVLHGMNGFLLVNREQIRLHHVEGRMAHDVSIGFGLLATVKAGSNFSSTRGQVGGEWRTLRVISDVQGRVAFFKTIAKNQDVTRSMFERLEKPQSLPQAVAKAEIPAVYGK